MTKEVRGANAALFRDDGGANIKIDPEEKL
jgi:hypothetical protein